MKDRTKYTMKKFSITKNIEKLTSDLQKIKYIGDIEYDLDSLIDNTPYIIIIVEYKIPVSLNNYYKVRSEFVSDVVRVAQDNGLTRTKDSIEDYGQHFYFVFRHNSDWVHRD